MRRILLLLMALAAGISTLATMTFGQQPESFQPPLTRSEPSLRLGGTADVSGLFRFPSAEDLFASPSDELALPTSQLELPSGLLPLPSTPSLATTSAAEISISSVVDASQALQQSNIVQSVTAQRRTPVSFDPHVRGFRFGQVFSQADGQYWAPIRQDLDSMLSKIDPTLVRTLSVIPGPYAVRYGPGFGFIDMQTLPTPRYDNGYESHLRVGMKYQTNGDQWFGNTAVAGGAGTWGYRFNYANRTGSDYESGNGTLIPASYHSQNFLGQLGFDLTPDSYLEFRYQRLDQTDSEYALQFFDVDFLGTDSFNVNYVNSDPCARYTSFHVDSWYSRTVLSGGTRNPSKRPVVERVEAALEQSALLAPVTFDGQTDGDQSLFGTRVYAVFGEDDAPKLNVGADIRYRDNRLNERFDITEDNPPSQVTPILTNLPTSWAVDPGLYAELTVRPHDYITSTVGGRLDFYRTGARNEDLDNFGPDDLTQNDLLYAFFLSHEFLLTPEVNARLGFGHAQRAPTLLERYADGLFLGVIQSGFSRVIGDPNLDKERLWQIDLTADADYELWRGRSSVFYSWVEDFITYEGNIISPPEDARLLRTLNTDYATMYGFEMYAELDLTPRLVAFGSLNYVRGHDEEINVPLWGIAPLEGRAGLRLQDAQNGARWGVECWARMVNGQDRIGLIRGVAAPGTLIPIESVTPGFTTASVRGYYNVSESVTLTSGIDNIFDRNYIEHLDLRLPADAASNREAAFAFATGFNAYFGVEWRR